MHAPSTCNSPLPQNHHRYDNNIINDSFKISEISDYPRLLVTCTSLAVFALHSPYTWEFALKNELHQLHVMHF